MKYNILLINSGNIESVIEKSIECGDIHSLIISKSNVLLYEVKEKIVKDSEKFVDIEVERIEKAFLLKYTNGSDILVAHKTHDIGANKFDCILYDKSDYSNEYINYLVSCLI